MTVDGADAGWTGCGGSVACISGGAVTGGGGGGGGGGGEVIARG